MHHFYIHKYFSFHQSLQKELLPSVRHLHLSTKFIFLILEFLVKEAFLLIFSIVGLLLYEQNSILQGFYLGVELNSSCIWKSLG